MKITPAVELYNRIMDAENEAILYTLNLEIQCAVIRKLITNEIEIMMLNLAYQLKVQNFLVKEFMLSGGGFTVIMADKDFDPEQMQLEEFHENELDDIKDGNVFHIKDFLKKK